MHKAFVFVCFVFVCYFFLIFSLIEKVIHFESVCVCVYIYYSRGVEKSEKKSIIFNLNVSIAKKKTQKKKKKKMILTIKFEQANVIVFVCASSLCVLLFGWSLHNDRFILVQQLTKNGNKITKVIEKMRRSWKKKKGRKMNTKKDNDNNNNLREVGFDCFSISNVQVCTSIAMDAALIWFNVSKRYNYWFDLIWFD